MTRLTLFQLNIPDNLGDHEFSVGQLATASSTLGDPLAPGSTTEPAWEPEYKESIHGCFNVTGESKKTIKECIIQLETILTDAIKILKQVDGAVRRGPEKGHEYFGFMDSLSQPAVIGFRLPNAGESATGTFYLLLHIYHL